jgi:hypothetical protein
MIFMPLAIMAADSGPSFIQDAWMLFEYRDKAGPVCINGYPIFFSVQRIVLTDAPAFKHYAAEYKAMKQKFLEQPIPLKISVPGSTL